MGVASFRQLILGLSICTACTFSNTPLRADAESDSLFTFTPPIGWRRALGSNEIIHYINPENKANCRISVSPPQAVSIDDFQETYNLLFEEKINAFGDMGYFYDSQHEPSFERNNDGSHQIYSQVVLENNEGDVIYYQAKFISKDEHAQMLEWIGDLKKCAFESIQAKSSFDTVRLKALRSNS